MGWGLETRALDYPTLRGIVGKLGVCNAVMSLHWEWLNELIPSIVGEVAELFAVPVWAVWKEIRLEQYIM